MAIIKEYKGHKPKLGERTYLADNATVVGDVVMGDDCSVWFSAVVRGDVAPIRIGHGTNIQDCSCIHGTPVTGPVNIGDNVTIGHICNIHGCSIHSNVLIGMGSTLLDGCEVGEGAIVGAHALVLGGTKIGDGELWAGVPAKFIKMAREGMSCRNGRAYVKLKDEYGLDLKD